MAARQTDGSVTLKSPDEEARLLSERPDATFDWIDFKCSCPNCGRALSDFRTKDLCNTLDTLDYRIAYYFYAECECGTWIDFIRKPASSIEDFDVRVEQL